MPGSGQADGLRDAAGEHGARHGEGTDGERKPRRAPAHVGDLPGARDAQRGPLQRAQKLLSGWGLTFFFSGFTFQSWPKILAEPCTNRDGDALGAGAGRPEGPRRRHKRVARMHAARPHDEKLQVRKNEGHFHIFDQSSIISLFSNQTALKAALSAQPLCRGVPLWALGASLGPHQVRETYFILATGTCGNGTFRNNLLIDCPK